MRIFIAAIALVVTWSSLSTNARRPFSTSQRPPALRIPITSPQTNTIHHNRQLFDLRGGASKSKPKSKRKPKTSSSSSSTKNKHKHKKRTATGSTKVGQRNSEPTLLQTNLKKYKSILPLTRLYITCVVLTTLLGATLGDEAAHTLLGLDSIRLLYGLEIWRPFTAASFLGPPSLSLLMSGYYLYEYGTNLERVYGTSQHFIFLMVQILLLTAASMLFGLPFFGPSVITAMLHVMSRAVPHQKVKWLIFTVPYWALPYGLMLSDVLQAAQQEQPALSAAMPHILGILTGHFYYYHKFLWPRTSRGEDWLVAPDFLVRRLEPDRDGGDAARKKMESVLKKRKKGKGRKLGA